MSRTKTGLLTLIALLAFSGNSLLCRLALKQTSIDPATFTSIRLVAGAFALWLIVRARGAGPAGGGSWLSALALVAYAICFSFAYVNLSAATGALLLFGAVQATMIGYGLGRGERLSRVQTAGFVVALAGLVALLLPGIESPPLAASVLMVMAGISWGLYSLRGRYGGDPTRTTAGNFLRSVPVALLLGIVAIPKAAWDPRGVAYAVASGALASGAGYAVWYTALKGLKATQASTVQLAVPVITAMAGIVILGEPVALQTALSSIAVLGGIAIVLLSRAPTPR